jgi:hypothetical protein
MSTFAVSVTSVLPAVPVETYPSVVTVGVMSIVFDRPNTPPAVVTVADEPLATDGAVTDPAGIA